MTRQSKSQEASHPFDHSRFSTQYFVQTRIAITSRSQTRTIYANSALPSPLSLSLSLYLYHHRNLFASHARRINARYTPTYRIRGTFNLGSIDVGSIERIERARTRAFDARPAERNRELFHSAGNARAIQPSGTQLNPRALAWAFLAESQI